MSSTIYEELDMLMSASNMYEKLHSTIDPQVNISRTQEGSDFIESVVFCIDRELQDE